jgi:hypothetical protein
MDPVLFGQILSFTDNTGGETLQIEQEGGGVTLAVLLHELETTSDTEIFKIPALIKYGPKVVGIPYIPV